MWTKSNGTMIKGEYVQSYLEIDGKEDEDHPVDPNNGLKIRLDWETSEVTKASA